MSEHAEHHVNYVKIWAILVVLLIVSVIGPELGIRVVTLITAFGIAVVKAYLVAKNFMHINLAPRYVTYLCATGLVFMLLFFAGTAPDVMKKEGSGWEKPAWKQAAAEHAASEGAAAHH
jgi:caa(3)-type oxidase subunit IV